MVKNRNPFKVATCFYNPEKDWREPLITIYEPKALQKFGTYIALNKYCTRRILKNRNVCQLELPKESIYKISNVNTPEEYQQAKSKIGTTYV